MDVIDWHLFDKLCQHRRHNKTINPHQMYDSKGISLNQLLKNYHQGYQNQRYPEPTQHSNDLLDHMRKNNNNLPEVNDNDSDQEYNFRVQNRVKNVQQNLPKLAKKVSVLRCGGNVFHVTEDIQTYYCCGDDLHTVARAPCPVDRSVSLPELIGNKGGDLEMEISKQQSNQVGAPMMASIKKFQRLSANKQQNDEKTVFRIRGKTQNVRNGAMIASKHAVLIKGPTATCGASKNLFNRETHFCCGNLIYANENGQTQICCNGFYDSSPPDEPLGCCGNVPYQLSTSVNRFFPLHLYYPINLIFFSIPGLHQQTTVLERKFSA